MNATSRKFSNSLSLLCTIMLMIVVVLSNCSKKRTPPTLPGAHPSTWMEIASNDFHGSYVLRTGLGGCKKCHGSDLSGGKAEIACSNCHNPDSSGSCTRCHGGIDNETGAPPSSLRGYVSTDSLSVGAHTAHLSVTTLSHAFACNTCHVVPLFSWDSAHLDYNIQTGPNTSDSIAEVNFGSLGTGAIWSHTLKTCQLVYCHGNFSGGDTTNAPEWNGRDQAACGSCHAVDTNTQALGGIHFLHTSLFGLKCVDCHASVTDSALQIINVNLHVNGSADTLTLDSTRCAQCHRPGATGCVQCHGGTDNQTGAPPKGLHGETQTSQQAVGAHTAHLNGGSSSAIQLCSDCHLSYTSFADSGHFALDSDAEIVWSGFANRSSGASWNPTTNSCGLTYCHGNFTGGKPANSPIWTSTNQAACGSCHDVGTNPSALQGIHGLHVGSFGLICNDCHDNVVDAGNAVTNRTLHVNGTIDTATAFPAICANCHAQAPAGCNYCHGGIDNQTGAPPKGLRNETLTTQRAVGAHTAHLGGGTSSALVQCGACHTTYTNVADSGHFALDSVAEINWSGISNLNNGASWSRTTNTCGSTYCHGNFNGGKTTNAPVWTSANQADCGSCHDIGTNPSELQGIHDLHITGFDLSCNDCHANVVDPGNNVTNRSLHVNGVIDTATANPATCANCHTQAPAGCVYCHGGTDNPTGAPPKGLRNETLTSQRAVGAHTSHLSGGTSADSVQCVACHTTYTNVAGQNHFALDSVAEITWGSIANLNNGANWIRGSNTCGSTYCHGNFTGGKNANIPIWTGSGQADCGSCHDVGTNPSELQGIHDLHITGFDLSCNDCHANVVDVGKNITNRSLHVNGTVDTATANPSICANCHAPAPAGCVYCHGGNDNLTGAPPKGLRGETATTTIAVGAHTKHMNGSALASGLRCNDCHNSYTLVTDPGHYATDSLAEVVWGNFANRNGGANWSRSAKECTNTYCHGNFAGGYTANAPIWTSASQAACGSCHDVGIHTSFLLGEHSKHAGEGVACYRCHSATLNSSDQISDSTKHVDGIFTVRFWTGTGNWNASTNSCNPPSGQGCHGSEQWYPN